jgi:hypothetical protein
MSIKQERIKIVVDANGDASVDILKTLGPSCKKEADEWSDLFGKATKVVKKPEFFRQASKEENKNTQGIG